MGGNNSNGRKNKEMVEILKMEIKEDESGIFA